MTTVRQEMQPIFVDTIPGELEEGRIYLALKYRTVTHKCACGCGVEINTPLHPTGWSITYDGTGLSLWPSVGNWSEKCQSHYWIEKNKVHWGRRWTRDEVLEGRQSRREEIERFYTPGLEDEASKGDLWATAGGRSLLRRVGRWIRGKVRKRS